MGTRKRRIEAELFARPWFMSPVALQRLAAAASGPNAGFDDDDDDDVDRAYVMAGSIAIIPIVGPLTRGSYFGGTSYNEVTSMATAAVRDPAVKAVLLRVDSPGGEASGMFDAADCLYGLRGTKPIATLCDDSAFSAAYALASAADRVYVTRTGGTGSIGCWQAHVDLSRSLDKAGVKVTLVSAGARKVDGNSFEPLSDSARADMQDGVDRIREMFVQTVARNRTASVDALMSTEARCFMAEDGVPLLADEVGSMDAALTYLRGCTGDDDEDDFYPPASGPSTKAARATASFGTDPHSFIDRPVSAGQMRATIGVEKAAIFAVRNIGSAKLSTRSAAGGDRRISMLAVPYGALSISMGGFRETYQRGCFRGGLEQSDPRALFNHDEAYVLGRKSAGTATFYEDAAGVHVEVDAPQTQWANDLLTSMRRGDITQASASFWILQHRWEDRGAEGRIRIIEKAVMRESSVLAFAAYESTTATATSEASAETMKMYRLGLDRASGKRLTDLENRELDLYEPNQSRASDRLNHLRLGRVSGKLTQQERDELDILELEHPA